MSKFISRKEKPEKGNKFYNTVSAGGYSKCIKGKPTISGLNVLCNCVGYACGRFNEIIGEMKYPNLNCNAENFIERAKTYRLEISDVPVIGGIMCWQKGATLSGTDGAGHVAIVENIVSADEIETSESGYNSFDFKYKTRKKENNWGMSSSYKFRGCIVNPYVEKVEIKKEIKETDVVNYKIQKGDTLSAIAKKYKTTIKKLMSLNPKIKDKNKIYAGDTIRVK